LTILYVETNLLMSFAAGRESEAERLLSWSRPPLRVVAPGVCFMEAIKTHEAIRKGADDFARAVDKRKSEAMRDRLWPGAETMINSLESLSLMVSEQSAETESRLFRAIRLLSEHAEVIEVRPEIVCDCLEQRVIVQDMADNFILHAIAHHARTRTGEDKAFLTSDTAHFGKREVRDFLRAAGVSRLFREAAACASWADSLGLPDATDPTTAGLA
jgi:hypothetical protein